MGTRSEPLAMVRARPTMREVAALAGVALKTVSRVMNDVPTVDPVLAGRVRTAAGQLGYRPNVAASNLRRSGGRTGTIGLLVEDVGNPFSAAIHRAVEEVARARDVLILTGSMNEDPDRELHLARTLIDRRCDGLIIMPTGDDYRWVAAEMNAGTAFAFVDRTPMPLMADAVVVESRLGAAEGVGHLIARGHRRVAFLGDDLTIHTARERHLGYQDALRSAGIGYDPHLVRIGLRTAQEAQTAVNSLLDHARPSALFAGQNLISVGAIQALHAAHLQDDVALVGFDDLALADLLRPALTVVRQDVAAIGRRAAERLFARLDGDLQPPQIYAMPTQLVRRGSGEIEPRHAYAS